MTFLPRYCPACGSSDLWSIFSQSFDAKSTLPLLLRGYDVVVCAECGCGYADNIPPQVAFDAYYRDLSKYEYHAHNGYPSPEACANFRLFADLIEPALPNKNARILDIGCATGAMLAELKRRGYKYVFGVDPAPACAASARRLFEISVLTSSIFDIPTGHTYDLLLLTGVLEHIRDVRRLLSSLRKICSPNGLLFIEVPDATRFAETPNAPFQHFSMEHVNFFSPVSLALTLHEAGWGEVEMRKIVAHLSASTCEPAVASLFRPMPRMNRGDCDRTIPIDIETEPALRRYVEQSKKTADHVDASIECLAIMGGPLLVWGVLVWGVGTNTMRLLATSRLADVPIVAFVDSNRNYQGKELHGRPIISPEEVRKYSGPILVTSWMYQQEIVRQIKEMHLPNEVILLYHVPT